MTSFVPGYMLAANANVSTTGAVVAGNVSVTANSLPTNGLYLSAANTLAFATNSTQVVTITSTGNVGVGSSTPQQLLDVNGNIRAAGTVVMSSAYTMRNIIINGAMQVWQRGTSFVNPSVGGNFYTADRWAVNRAGDVTGSTASRSTSVPAGFQYSLALQRTAGDAGTAGLFLFYSNETVNSIQLQGQSITLSFWARSGANYSGGSLSIVVNTGTGTDQRVYAYTGSSSIISATQAITSTWTRYSFVGTVPSNATEIGFYLSWTPTGTAGADDAVYFTGLQLEAGSVATPFEYRSFAQEVTMCQRYYEKSYDLTTNPGTNTEGGMAAGYFNATGGINQRFSIFFKATKRSVPNVSGWDAVGNANKCSAWNSGNARTDNLVTGSRFFGLIGTQSFAFNEANLGAYYAFGTHWTADSEL